MTWGLQEAAFSSSAMERALDDALSAVLRGRHQNVKPSDSVQVVVRYVERKQRSGANHPTTATVLRIYDEGGTANDAMVETGVSKARIYQIAVKHGLDRWRRKRWR